MNGVLLAIDPGGIGGDTGIVLLGVPEDEPAYVRASWAVPNGLSGFRKWNEACHWLEDANIVVCEHFVNRNIPGADLSPCFIEGAVAYLRPDAYLQPASGKNTAVTDNALKRVGGYDFPKDHHHDQREASRHAYWWLKKNKHLPTLHVMYPH